MNGTSVTAGSDDTMKEAARHRENMQRKKARVDANIARASIDRGVLVVNTGAGKMRVIKHAFEAGIKAQKGIEL